MPRSKKLIETGIEPRIQFTLISRDTALKANACLPVLVVPDYGAACTECLSSAGEEQGNLDYFAGL